MNSSMPVRSVSINHDSADLMLDAGVVVRVPFRFCGLDKYPTELLGTWALSDDRSRVEWTTPGGRPVRLEPSDLLWEALRERTVGRLADAGYQLADLDPRDQRIVALHRLVADVCNGGFLQFYCNWGEEIYQLAIDGLKEIGAQATLELLQPQRAVLDRVLALPDIEEYWQIPALLTEEEHRQVGGELDMRFEATADELAPLAASRYLPGFAAERVDTASEAVVYEVGTHGFAPPASST
jgi:hypothetical protein